MIKDKEDLMLATEILESMCQNLISYERAFKKAQLLEEQKDIDVWKKIISDEKVKIATVKKKIETYNGK